MNTDCVIPMCLITACSITSAAVAGLTIDTLVLEGDTVAEVGDITSIAYLSVNTAGDWLVEADTNNADADIDSVVIRGGALFLQEGDALTAPVGSGIGSFDSLPLAGSTSATSYNFFLDGVGGVDDSGVYYGPTANAADIVLVAQEGSEAPGLTPGTPFIGFFETRVNDAGEIFVMASVDDPKINSSVDRAMYILTTDNINGGISTFTLIAAEGDVLPDQSEPVGDFRTNPHQMAFAENGDVLFGADLVGDTSVDGTVYFYSDGVLTLIAQEGSVSPVDGRTWSALSSPEMDLNSNGQFAYSGSLDGDPATNNVILRNDDVVAQEGDAVTTDSGTWAITSFGSGPVLIDDCGNVLYYGDWNDADGDIDTGLFLNDQLLAQEGVSTADGVIIDTLRGVQDGYTMSDDGRYILFEAILVDGNEGAFMIDLGKSCDPGKKCLGDFDNSGDVGTTDLLDLLAAWGSDDSTFDIAPNGNVGIDDLLLLLSLWGDC